MRFTETIANVLSTRAAVAFGWALAVAALSCLPAGLAQSGPVQGQGNKPAARVRTQLEGFDLSSKAGKTVNQTGGASRGFEDIGKPTLYAPIMGKAYTTNPEFHWAAEQGAKVTFRLMTDDGRTVYETATTSDHLRYPGDAPALAPGGMYKWTVIPPTEAFSPPSVVGFTIVSGPEREAILNDMKNANSASAIADVFFKHRIWYDAVQGYSDVISRTPSDANAHAARGQLYDQLDATKTLADADWRMVH